MEIPFLDFLYIRVSIMNEKTQIAMGLMLMVGCVNADGQLQPDLADLLASGRQLAQTGLESVSESTIDYHPLVEQAITVGKELSTLQQIPFAHLSYAQANRLQTLYHLQRNLQRAFDRLIEFEGCA